MSSVVCAETSKATLDSVHQIPGHVDHGGHGGGHNQLFVRVESDAPQSNPSQRPRGGTDQLETGDRSRAQSCPAPPVWRRTPSLCQSSLSRTSTERWASTVAGDHVPDTLFPEHLERERALFESQLKQRGLFTPSFESNVTKELEGVGWKRCVCRYDPSTREHAVLRWLFNLVDDTQSGVVPFQEIAPILILLFDHLRVLSDTFPLHSMHARLSDQMLRFSDFLALYETLLRCGEPSTATLDATRDTTNATTGTNSATRYDEVGTTTTTRNDQSGRLWPQSWHDYHVGLLRAAARDCSGQSLLARQTSTDVFVLILHMVYQKMGRLVVEFLLFPVFFAYYGLFVDSVRSDRGLRTTPSASRDHRPRGRGDGNTKSRRRSRRSRHSRAASVPFVVTTSAVYYLFFLSACVYPFLPMLVARCEDPWADPRVVGCMKDQHLAENATASTLGRPGTYRTMLQWCIAHSLYERVGFAEMVGPLVYFLLLRAYWGRNPTGMQRRMLRHFRLVSLSDAESRLRILRYRLVEYSLSMLHLTIRGTGTRRVARLDLQTAMNVLDSVHECSQCGATFRSLTSRLPSGDPPSGRGLCEHCQESHHLAASTRTTLYPSDTPRVMQEKLCSIGYSRHAARALGRDSAQCAMRGVSGVSGVPGDVGISVVRSNPSNARKHDGRRLQNQRRNGASTFFLRVFPVLCGLFLATTPTLFRLLVLREPGLGYYRLESGLYLLNMALVLPIVSMFFVRLGNVLQELSHNVTRMRRVGYVSDMRLALQHRIGFFVPFDAAGNLSMWLLLRHAMFRTMMRRFKHSELLVGMTVVLDVSLVLLLSIRYLFFPGLPVLSQVNVSCSFQALVLTFYVCAIVLMIARTNDCLVNVHRRLLLGKCYEHFERQSPSFERRATWIETDTELTRNVSSSATSAPPAALFTGMRVVAIDPTTLHLKIAAEQMLNRVSSFSVFGVNVTYGVLQTLVATAGGSVVSAGARFVISRSA